MEKDLIKFMANIKPINKDISLYESDNTLFYMNTVQLLTKVETLELSKEEYQVKKFEGSIDDLEYQIEEVDRPVSKYTITKKEEDKYVITNTKVKVRKVYNVSNAIGIHKSFTNVDDAMELAKDINKNLITYFN